MEDPGCRTERVVVSVPPRGGVGSGDSHGKLRSCVSKIARTVGARRFGPIEKGRRSEVTGRGRDGVPLRNKCRGEGVVLVVPAGEGLHTTGSPRVVSSTSGSREVLQGSGTVSSEKDPSDHDGRLVTSPLADD